MEGLVISDWEKRGGAPQTNIDGTMGCANLQSQEIVKSMRITEPKAIVLYDGVCGLCNRAVQFLLKRDRHDRFRFAALQSDFAASLLQRHGIDPTKLDTVYAVVN